MRRGRDMVSGLTNRVRTPRCMSIGLIALVLIAGYGGCRDTGPTSTMDSDRSTNSRVIIHSPATGATGASNRADLFWDGKQVFSGKLPTRRSGLDGMPVQLGSVNSFL